jgi:hypothetical protein
MKNQEVIRQLEERESAMNDLMIQSESNLKELEARAKRLAEELEGRPTGEQLQAITTELSKVKQDLAKEAENKSGIEKQLTKTEQELESLKTAMIQQENEKFQRTIQKLEGKPTFRPPEGSFIPRPAGEEPPTISEPSSSSEPIEQQAEKKKERKQRATKEQKAKENEEISNEDTFKAYLLKEYKALITAKTLTQKAKRWMETEFEAQRQRDKDGNIIEGASSTDAKRNVIKSKFEKYVEKGKFPEI